MTKKRKHFTPAAELLLTVVLTGGCATAPAPAPESGAAAEATAPAAGVNGVVLMIGDGMGFSQIAAARNILLERGERFSFETIPEVGIVTTWSDSNPTTDSGAAATTMATGVKTSNQYIGMSPDLEPVTTLTEAALDQGWRVGYVTTTTVTHATPAGFYAHVRNRYADEDLIAEQFLDHRPTLALGGGAASFLPEIDGGQRFDDRNLLEEAEEMGYTVWNRNQFSTSDLPDRLLGLAAYGHLGYQLDERRYPPERRDPTLAAMTGAALEALAVPGKRFFLLVEGGRIDHAAHNFDAAGMAHEIAAFDDAVEVVRRFVAENPDTLLVLTADHATGGLAVNDYADWQALREQTATAEWLANQIRNAGAGVDLVAEHTAWDDVTEEDLEVIRSEGISYDAYRLLGSAIGERTGVTWMPRVSTDTFGHTGEDVPLFATGARADEFRGVLDNADIAERLAALMDLPAVGDVKDR